MTVPPFATAHAFCVSRDGPKSSDFLTLLAPDIKEQILLSCPHTFLIKVLGRSYKNIKKFTLGDHVFNSLDLRG